MSIPPFQKEKQMNKIIYTLLFLCLTLAAQAKEKGYDFVVAADGSGDFTTIQAAINAVPDYRKEKPTKILIRKGIYKEKVVIAQSKEKVQLIGEKGVVITYDDYASKPNIFGDNKGTSGSASIYIFCPDFPGREYHVRKRFRSCWASGCLSRRCRSCHVPSLPLPRFSGHTLHLWCEYP